MFKYKIDVIAIINISIKAILSKNNKKFLIPNLKNTIILNPHRDKLKVNMYINIWVVFAAFKVLLSIPLIPIISLSLISNITLEKSDISIVNNKIIKHEKYIVIFSLTSIFINSIGIYITPNIAYIINEL